MKQVSRSALVAMALLAASASSLAAGPSKAKTVIDEPDIVIGGGGSSRAMSLGTPRSVSVVAAPVINASAQVWTVETRDVNLANTFQRWAASAGWKVRWDAAKHVMLEAPDSFTGSFEDAVAAQLSSPGIAMSGYPLEVCFYPNTPPLARITRKGDQLKECK